MRQMRHTIGQMATAWWLLVCLCAPHLGALVPAVESEHACCRKKSTCCCRNRTGKASAIIGDRKDCSRTCGMAVIAVELMAAAPAPDSAMFRLAAGVACLYEGRDGALRSSLAVVLHQRPPPSF